MTRVNPKTEFKFLILEAIKHRKITQGLLQAEVLFCKNRFWRFDFAIYCLRVAFEYEGRGKGHLSWVSYSKDCEKYTWASILGWTVVRITPGMIQDGRAGPLIRAAISAAIDPATVMEFQRYSDEQVSTTSAKKPTKKKGKAKKRP